MSMCRLGNILYHNSGVSKILVLPPERILGCSLGLFFVGPNKGVMDPDGIHKVSIPSIINNDTIIYLWS